MTVPPDTTDPTAPADDQLQRPFTPREPEDVLDFAEVHKRYPAMADFHARLGGTSLREVPSVPGGARILAKCEWENPNGSVKDRTAYALMADALRGHGDRPPEELRLLVYSGGKLASAMSLLGQQTGVRTKFVLMSTSPPSLLALLKERGAEVELVPTKGGFLQTIRASQRIAAAEPGWTVVFQHANPVNVAIHQQTTGGEILADLGDTRPAAWLASIGSGGTFVGVLRALRSRFPDVRAIGVTPEEAPYGALGPLPGKPTYEGSGGHGYGIRQPFVKAHDDLVEGHRHVTLPRALQGMGEFHDLTGVKIGSSSAANWLTAREVAAELPSDAVVVTVFACAGQPEQWSELGR
ncbi:pyridoxal-phosphate dependent enzyme [Streptomyces sp. TS71-3]|uniref:pyridoxal-phosphate dependent enzyme n=1 Tax=Streptomyces sp. TS71-3 TaxID=2733862 RepID=UPI001B04B2F4|nr:pyridoxal-phosphate dependent enzyme [Streptomyces sp. TS71-3]GHJ37203.1 cysteine synthase B [Streptomyces sp. TS71-3]